MPHAPRIAAVACLVAGLGAPPVAAGDVAAYRLDPVHTRVVFAVGHAGFSQAIGTISGSTGTLRFDPDDWRSARLDVTVPLARLDLGDRKWNDAVLGAGLLDAHRHPQARFVSREVQPADADRARVCGELTLRGATRPLCLDVTLNALGRHPLPPFRRTAGFSATATLSRREFGVDAWPTVIGDRVELRIEAEAVRSRSEDDAPAPPVEAAPAPAQADPAPPIPIEPPEEPPPPDPLRDRR